MRWSAGQWAWAIGKNLIGWVLILAAPVIGIGLPGPGGVPMFVVGFALVSFPGKRRLTSRVLAGRQVDVRRPAVRWTILAVALALPPVVVWLFARRKHSIIHPAQIGIPATVALYVGAIAGTWVTLRWLMRAVNLALRHVPRLRRKVRPWLRGHGFRLLPPRRRARLHRQPKDPMSDPEEEILEIDQRQKDNARHAWGAVKPWVKPVLGLLITVAIFAWMLKPVVRQWSVVRDRVFETSLPRFALAAVMFAVFLFVFRAMSWRKIIEWLGRRLPVAAATRIWSTSELARYLPGVIWQVAGRVYLVRPYGVSASTCSMSQVLELSIFVLANLLVTLACLPWFAGHMPPPVRVLLYAASALAPLLLLLLQPRVFFGVINAILGWVGKPPLPARISGRALLGLIGWAVLGLLWQGLAIWMLMGQHEALDLPFSRLGLVVGAYCLAWCAGFLAFWAPGGIGVRELVLVRTLHFVLPRDLVDRFNGDAAAFTAFLVFLSVLLRLWTIAGEMIVAGVSYTLDYRGALGDPNAPGRVPLSAPPLTASHQFTAPAASHSPAAAPPSPVSGIAGDTRS